MMEQDRGVWMQTFLHRKLFFLDPRPEDFTIEEIAQQLSTECRFSNCVRRPYFVAEHSVHVSTLCDPKDALWGLMHDAEEAYFRDIPSQIKHLPMMKEYRKVAKNCRNVILERFGLPMKEPESVRRADNWMLQIEAQALMAPLVPGWDQYFVYPIPEGLSIPSLEFPWGPERARRAFLARFKELTRIR